jgi:Domain of unknown function (DUF4440)
MKKIITSLFFLLCIHTGIAQTKQMKEVAYAVEQLKVAMVNADSVVLNKLVSTKLSYGHSGGAIDDKKIFLEKLVSGKSDFVTMDLSEQVITISKKTAIVRHALSATTNDNGKPGIVSLKVMQVWLKQNGVWVLVARQAIKLQP